MKKEDINGFWIFKDTPITKEGVFPYKGRQIDSDGSMGLDPNRKYMVYRPWKELAKPETLESMNGLFLTDEHEMLGTGQRDAGTKRIDGTVYEVHVSPAEKGVVLGTLKVMSRALKDLIQSGKRQLSCGYYCDYEPQQGVWHGIPYQFVQTNVTGNHIALVKKGRMGEMCAVMDSAYMTECAKDFANYGRKESRVRGKGNRSITCDSAIDINPREVTFMPTENYDEMLAKALEGKGVKDKVNIDKIVEFINSLPAAPAAKDAAEVPSDDPNAPAGGATPPPAAPVAPAATPADDPEQTADGDDDAACGPGGCAPQPISKEEFQAAVAAAVAERYAKEDEGRQLAEDIASNPKCGNLWKRGMDADDVAEAACEKLGHKDLPKEARVPFVQAMAAESKKAKGLGKTGMDSAFDAAACGRSSVMKKYLGM